MKNKIISVFFISLFLLISFFVYPQDTDKNPDITLLDIENDLKIFYNDLLDFADAIESTDNPDDLEIFVYDFISIMKTDIEKIERIKEKYPDIFESEENPENIQNVINDIKILLQSTRLNDVGEKILQLSKNHNGLKTACEAFENIF